MLNERAGDSDAVDVLELVRSRMPGLTASGRRVADAVLAAPEQVLGMSAARLATASRSSVGTVVRFCHSIGFPGYQEFKLRLAAHTRPGWYRVKALENGDRRSGTVDTVLGNILVSLARTADSIDQPSIARAADVLGGARRILIAASGTSQPLATEFGNWLSRSGLSVSHPTDSQTQEAIAERLEAQDACFAISHSGTTAQTLHPTNVAAHRGAGTVALTSFTGSPLAELCDVVVVAGAPADAYRSADMASRMVHHAVLQAMRSVIHQQ